MKFRRSSNLRLAALGILYAALLQFAGAQSILRLDGTRIQVSEADAFAKSTFAAQHVTGAQIAVINHGKLVWSAAYGLRRKDPPLPVDQQTTFWAASITKSVFATYVMTLVERGEFNLDQPVADQLDKSLDQYEPYKDKASELVKDPAWRTVTPRMLLSHSSGLKNFTSNEADNKLRLHFKPGTQFLYSGEGINLVQFIIENKFQQPLDQILQQAFFTPLGMTRTGIIYRQEFAADIADRYDRDEKFVSQTKRFPARAAGSMTTSAEDLARFTTALLNGKILRKAAYEKMLSPVLPINTVHEFGFGDSEGAGQEAISIGLAYGVGWGLLTHTPYGPAFFKEGHGDGAQNYMICFQRSKSCMILLTNSDNGELSFRPLLEKILGDRVTPWEWEGYTPSYIERSRENP